MEIYKNILIENQPNIDPEFFDSKFELAMIFTSAWMGQDWLMWLVEKVWKLYTNMFLKPFGL